MISRVIITLFFAASSLFANAVTEESVNGESFLSYDDLRQLVVRGNVNVIMGGDSHLNVIEYDPEQVVVKRLPGDVFDLSPTSPKSKATPTVVVRSNERFKHLFQISVREQSSLLAKDIESLSLAVDVKTSGSVMMEGVMNLNHLNIIESNEVEIFWIDSPHLDISIEKGEVVLAGRTGFLTLQGRGDADVDAAGLIAKRSWVSGVDNAKIAVFPVDELFAYTKDNSIVDVKQKPYVYAPVNQAPSTVVLNYVEMERRAAALLRRDN